jgi:hypothetical protein
MTSPGDIDDSNANMSRRYGFDFQDLNAYGHLCHRYMSDQRFIGALDILLKGIPKELKRDEESSKDQSKNRRKRLSVVDLYHPRGPYGPLAFDALVERFRSAWTDVKGYFGEDDDWVRSIGGVAREWGLRASWGEGALLAWMYERHFMKERAEGETELALPDYGFLELDFRIMPKVEISHVPAPVAPRPSLGMSIREWRQRVKEYREDGERYLAHYREVLKGSPYCGVASEELERDVEWLFKRITPPYRTPVELAYDAQEVDSEYTVKGAITKAAKLLGIRVPRGRTPKKRRRSRRK